MSNRLQNNKIRRIFESDEPQTTYQKLLKIAQSTEDPNITFDEEIVFNFTYNQRTPRKSMITLNFDTDEDYFQLFYETEDNPKYMERIINDRRYYDRFEFESSDYIWEDWKEGYILMDFNDENILKLKDILLMVNPELADFNPNLDDKSSSIARFLHNTFEREIDYILDERWQLVNDCKVQSEQNNIKKDMCDRLFNYGIFSKGDCFETYVTSVNILISLYEETKNFDVDLYEMLKQVAINTQAPDYYEYYYETSCDNWEEVSTAFNQEISKRLDEILDRIENSDEFNFNRDLFKLYSKEVYNNYQINRWYELPYNKEYSFRLVRVEPANDRIVLFFQKPNSQQEKRSYNLEGFIDFLHNPELFENKIRKIRKI